MILGHIIRNALQWAVGAGTANACVNHNFINASRLAAGGFRISLEVIGFAGATLEQGGAFAVGMSAADAALAAGLSGADSAPESNPDSDRDNNLVEWLKGGTPAETDDERRLM